MEANRWKPFEIPPSGKPELLQVESEAPTAMAFDRQNRPYWINNRNPDSFGKIRTIRDGQWVTLSVGRPLLGASVPNKKAMGELVLDDRDCLYATMGGKLVYSVDRGETFEVYSCSGNISLELRVGPNQLSEPPCICLLSDLCYVDRAKERQGHMAWWAQRGTLSILLPQKDNNGLVLGDPIRISDRCLTAGSGGHSGGTSAAVTLGNRTHIVYATVPEDPRKGGNPIRVATIHRPTRTVESTTFLVAASPAKADVHTRPTICADRQGYLHVLSGSHGEPFYYLRSLRPNDSSAWTTPVPLRGRQCYASLVCDGKDRLHTVFREWRPHASLGYSWCEDGNWKQPTVTLVHGANPRGRYAYGIFYHRLFVDRASNLYLAFTFWEQTTQDKGDYPECLAVSEDGGATWHLAAQDVLVASIIH